MKDPNLAKDLFREYTDGNIDRLWGKANLSRRQEIISALQGRKATQAEAGWNKFRRAMLALYEIEGDCRASEHCHLCKAVRTGW